MPNPAALFYEEKYNKSDKISEKYNVVHLELMNGDISRCKHKILWFIHTSHKEASTSMKAKKMDQ